MPSDYISLDLNDVAVVSLTLYHPDGKSMTYRDVKDVEIERGLIAFVHGEAGQRVFSSLPFVLVTQP